LLRALFRARLVQLHEQLHNFNSQTTNSLSNSLVSLCENSLSHGEAAKTWLSPPLMKLLMELF
jgi:hypothetical protein